MVRTTACLVTLAIAATASAQPAELPPELDGYIASALRDWDIPGAAIAIVKDGKLVVAKGYGVREMGKPGRVDADTIFDAASLTKAFTAAAIATLVDDKRMTWDDPARRHLPALEFADPYLTANVTIRDLLCHRSGVRNNSAWYFTALTRPQLLGVVKDIRPQAPFRTRLVYSNLGYAIAGEAAAAAAGMSWDDLVTKRLIAPLGMKRTTVAFLSVPGMTNVATGHALFGIVQGVAPREGAPRVTTAAAGAVQSSAADLATWMLFQLGDGTFRGKRLISADAMAEMHSPQIAVATTPAFRAARGLQYFAGYGLGWQVFDYHGHKFLWHTGSGDGQSAFMGLLPERQLGVVVLVNSSKAGPAFNGALVSRIFDHYLGRAARDHSAESRASWNTNLQRAVDELRKTAAARLVGTRPSLPLAGFAGVYRDQLGLAIAVTVDGDQLRLRYAGGEPATLSHWHHDAFRLQWQNRLHAEDHGQLVSFELSELGVADRLRIRLMNEDIEARRVP